MINIFEKQFDGLAKKIKERTGSLFKKKGREIMDKEIVSTTKVAVFRNKKVRKTIYKDEWWFFIIDIVEALTESDRPRKYWSDLKKKLVNEGYSEVSEKIGQLKLEAPDGKMRETDCANTETMFVLFNLSHRPRQNH